MDIEQEISVEPKSMKQDLEIESYFNWQQFDSSSKEDPSSWYHLNTDVGEHFDESYDSLPPGYDPFSSPTPLLTLTSTTAVLPLNKEEQQEEVQKLERQQLLEQPEQACQRTKEEQITFEGDDPFVVLDQETPTLKKEQCLVINSSSPSPTSTCCNSTVPSVVPSRSSSPFEEPKNVTTLSSFHNTPVSRKRKLKEEPIIEDDNETHAKKEKNRVAAQRYRQKLREEASRVVEQVNFLESQNETIRNQIEVFRRQLEQDRKIILHIQLMLALQNNQTQAQAQIQPLKN